MNILTRFDISVHEDMADAVSGVFARHVSFGWEEISQQNGTQIFRLYTDNDVLLDALLADVRQIAPQVTISWEQVENEDWANAWREYFTPVQAGAFVILPPWLHPLPLAHPLRDLQPIVIDPKSAFGTGHHSSTALCLIALGRLLAGGQARAGMQVLDLGAGTGILGIGAAKCGLSGVLADIDPVSVDNSKENVCQNCVEGQLEVLTGSIDAVENRKFDLIFANILAEPLRLLAPRILAGLNPGGSLVLSGILSAQAADVAAAYEILGEPAYLEQDEWVCLVWPNVDSFSRK
jgi:ribosomal protein L11 methyltransferase